MMFPAGLMGWVLAGTAGPIANTLAFISMFLPIFGE